MSYEPKIDATLTITVTDERYRAEFDGSEIYIHDPENNQRIVYSGTMKEALEIGRIIYAMSKEVNNTKIVREEV